MERIIHPQTGENGYFCTCKQKALVDALVSNFSSQLLLQSSHEDVRGGEFE